MTDKLPLIIKEKSFNIPIYLYSDVGNNEYDYKKISRLTRLPYVKDPIILLPDTHQKHLLETPSSSVVIIDGRFSLALTSPSQNCGMSLILTPLFKKEISESFIGGLISKIKTSIPLKNQSPIISKEDVLQALLHGSEWAIKKYGLPSEISDHIECNGNLLAGSKSSSLDIQKAVPDEIIELSRRRFNIIGGGNHFLEFQIVDEIFDERIAHQWGVKRDQIVIMFHTGSDALGAYLGRLYAFRKKTSMKQHIYFFNIKMKHHLMQGPWYSLPTRFSYYFLPFPYRFIDPDEEEGQRAFLAVNCAANFGFANRTAVFNNIQRAFGESLGDNNFKMNLLYDCSHNSIYEEIVGDKPVWAHRHNACRVYPASLLKTHPFFSETGQPVILPGTNRTSSFLCAGREGAVASYYTVDHGLGTIQKRYEETGAAKETGEYSNFFSYDKDSPIKTTMSDDSAISDAIERLSAADIINPVARLKPFATLKGPKPKII